MRIFEISVFVVNTEKKKKLRICVVLIESHARCCPLSYKTVGKNKNLSVVSCEFVNLNFKFELFPGKDYYNDDTYIHIYAITLCVMDYYCYYVAECLYFLPVWIV